MPTTQSTGITMLSGRAAAMRSGPGASPISPSSQFTTGPMMNEAPIPAAAPTSVNPAIQLAGMVTVTAFSAIGGLFRPVQKSVDGLE